jgi:flagellar M-ring protein FliF
MQRSDQNSGTQAGPTGVPGTASNAPNVKPPLFPTQNQGTQSLRQESGTYGASKRVRHTVQGAGKVRRITAAILINHRMQMNGKQISWQPRTAEEMKHLTDLVQATIGFDSGRGDQVSVEDMAFEDNSDQPATKGFDQFLTKATQAEPVWKYGALLAAFLCLVFFVIRPMMRKGEGVSQAVATDATTDAQLSAGGEPVIEAPDAAEERKKKHAQVLFDTVSEHLRQEPAQTARLLQSWIHME